MDLEDNLDDENINEIFRFQNSKEMKLYYELMLQQKIDDEKNIIEVDMSQYSTYKLDFEEVQGMLRQPITMEHLHQQMNKQKFEGCNKKKKLKQFRGYMIWKKRNRK